MYVCIYIYMYIYIYRERERERYTYLSICCPVSRPSPSAAWASVLGR